MSNYHYGGQALLEGVMIRGQKAMAIAVRAPSGEIVLREEQLPQPSHSWKRWPFFRGVFGLWDTLNLGVRAIIFSGNVALGESEKAPEAPGVLTAEAEVDPAPPPSKDKYNKLGAGETAGVVAFSLIVAVGLFFLLPRLLIRLIERAVTVGWLQVLLEGAVRLGIVLGYLAAVSLLPDLKRVFAYHGAEHKTVNALEAGAPLDVEGVRPFSTAHTRCGTAFLLLVVVLAVPIFAPLSGLPLVWQLLSRIVLVPVVAAVAYEVMRLGAEHADKPVVRALLAPALLLQRLTTRQPDDRMLEVAIAALKKAMEIDQGETTP